MKALARLAFHRINPLSKLRASLSLVCAALLLLAVAGSLMAQSGAPPLIDRVKHRSIKQDPVVIELDFKGNKVTGTMTQSGQAKAIDVDLGGICFADGGGAFDVIGRLPLADGYSTTFRNLDVQKQKPQIKNLKVVGSESITVPGGTFDAFKVEVVDANNEADKQTVWIAKDLHKVVKISAVLVSLGGAVLTSELVP